MKRNSLFLLAALLLCAFLLNGCGAEGGEATADLDISENTSIEATADGTSQRKVIVNAYYALETEALSQATAALESLTAASSGYVQEADVESEDGSYSYARYELRIPAQQVESVADGLAQLGVVTEYTQNAEDVTDAYYDVEARRKAKEAQRDRILAFMQEAATLDELLYLEEELAQVQAELDSLTGTINRYDQQVAYATVTVELWQNSLAESAPFGARLWRNIQQSFSASLQVLQGILMVLVWLLPYLLVGLLVLVIVLLATRKKRRQRKEWLRQQQTAAERPMPPPMP